MSDPENQSPTDQSAVTDQVNVAKETAEDPVADLLLHVSALRDYAEHLVASFIDRAQLRTSELAAKLMFMVALGIFVTGALIVAAYYAVRGIAIGLTQLTGQAWLGDSLAGIGGVLMVAAIIYVRRFVIQTRRRNRHLAEFARRKAAQRESYGRDVEQAARAAE